MTELYMMNIEIKCYLLGGLCQIFKNDKIYFISNKEK